MSFLFFFFFLFSKTKKMEEVVFDLGRRGGGGDEDDDDEEVEKKAAPLLEPDDPVWSQSPSFEALGRDVVGLIGRRLSAADCFSLALTSRRTYARLAALRLLKDAETRYRSLRSHVSLHAVDVCPLVSEMLSIPLPNFNEEPFSVSSNRGLCILFVPASHVNKFHTDSILKRIFRARGYQVRMVRFLPPYAHIVPFQKSQRSVERNTVPFRRKLSFAPHHPDTPSRVVGRLCEAKNLPPNAGAVRCGGLFFRQKGLAELAAYHFEMVEELLAHPDVELVVDAVFQEGTVPVAARALGISLAKYMHCYCDGAREFLVPSHMFFRNKELMPYSIEDLGPARVRELMGRIKNHKVFAQLLKIARARRVIVLVFRKLMTATKGATIIKAIREFNTFVVRASIHADVEIRELTSNTYALLQMFVKLFGDENEAQEYYSNHIRNLRDRRW